MSSILETVMLICFGLSWPINVMKAYKARTTKGTSLWFILLIITGYIAGIASKFLTPDYKFNYVLVVYFINLIIVSLNVIVYFRNKKLDDAQKN